MVDNGTTQRAVDFAFKKSSCVALGTFNIYVIQPALLADMGVIEPNDQLVRFEGDLTQPGFRFGATHCGNWTVRPERLAVESCDPEFDCGRHVGACVE